MAGVLTVVEHCDATLFAFQSHETMRDVFPPVFEKLLISESRLPDQVAATRKGNRELNKFIRFPEKEIYIHIDIIGGLINFIHDPRCGTLLFKKSLYAQIDFPILYYPNAFQTFENPRLPFRQFKSFAARPHTLQFFLAHPPRIGSIRKHDGQKSVFHPFSSVRLKAFQKPAFSVYLHKLALVPINE